MNTPFSPNSSKAEVVATSTTSQSKRCEGGSVIRLCNMSATAAEHIHFGFFASELEVADTEDMVLLPGTVELFSVPQDGRSVLNYRSATGTPNLSYCPGEGI